jgi:hypothetical protein
MACSKSGCIPMALPPLTSRYTRIALMQRMRRAVDEGTTLGLALEGISAAEVARGITV